MFLRHLLLVQLLLGVCILHVNAAPQASIRSIAPKADKYGIMPSKDFIGDMCKLLDNTFQMVPWPVRTDDICDNLGLNTAAGEAKYCPMFNIAKMLMGFLQASYPMQCAADSIIAPSDFAAPSSVQEPSTGLMLPTPFPSRLSANGLPAVFSADATAHLLKTEGPSYYWLYKHIVRLQAWAPCDAMGWRSSFAAPPGWSTMRIISAGTDLSQYEIQGTTMPFAAVLRRPRSAESAASCRSALAADAQATRPAGSPRRAAARLQNQANQLCSGDEVAVLVRGTAAASDWGYNFDMELVSNYEYGAGKQHRGFIKLADQVWYGGLKAALDEVKGTASSVTIAGHSLGGAAAAMLAARSEKYLNAARSATQVTVVTFGAPNIGDSAFAGDYNRRVNTRNIQFFADIVTQVPCDGSMIQCGYRTEAEADGTPASGNRTTIMSYPYARLGGRVVLRGSDMPMQQEAWDMLSTYTQDDFCDNRMSIGNLVEATHICSYMCALSSSNADMRGDWCLLWEDVEAAGARIKNVGTSFCMAGFNFMSDNGDFPTFPMFPSYKSQQWLAQQPRRRGPQNTDSRPSWAMPQPGAEQPSVSEHTHHHG